MNPFMPALEQALVGRVLRRFPDVTFPELIAMLRYDEGERPQGIEAQPDYVNWSNARIARYLENEVRKERNRHPMSPYRQMAC